MSESTWYRDLFDKSNDLIQIVALNGQLVKVNPSWVKVMQCSEEEALGKPIWDFIRPDFKDYYLSVREDTLRLKSRSEISTVLLNTKREEIFVEGSIEYIESGEQVYTRAIFRNVTEKVQTQFHVKVNEKRLQTIYQNAPDAIITIDANNRVVEWNPKAEEVFGFTAAFARGRLIYSLIIPEEYREAHIRGLSHFLKTGEGAILNKTVEVPAITASNQRIMIALTISGVKEDENWLFIAFITDITSRKQLEDELSKSVYELVHQRKLDRQKDDFLSIASHELKTPLTSIKAYNQLLQREVEDGQLLVLKKQEDQVRRLERLIGDLLDVSKISSGHLLYNKKDFSFDKVVHDALEAAVHLSKHHRLILINNAIACVNGDKHRIEQVLDNLLSNAVKYSPRGSQVVVKSSIEDGNVVLSVKDEGPGIPKEYLAQIFDRFFRIDETKKQTGGLGLGLYISCQIIQAHGGSIWAESEKGQGTTFFVSLPVTPADAGNST